MTLQRNKIVAAVAVGMLTLGGIGFNSAPVADARAVIGYVSEQAVSDINPNATVNLTIKKAKSNPFDEVPEGQLPPAPLAGYTFTVQRVQGIELTDPVDWERARQLTPDEARGLVLGPEISATTNADGVAHFTGLGVGLYLVTETAPESTGYTAWIADPFFLTLPTGNVDGSSWNYDVTVVAKNHPDVEEHTTPPSTIPVAPMTSPEITPPTSPGTSPVNTTTPRFPGDPFTQKTPGTSTPVAPQLGSPGGPSGTGAPTEPRPSGPLAQTGANVLWVVSLGMLLMLGGIFLLRRRHNSN